MWIVQVFIFTVDDKEYEGFLSHGGPQNHPQLTILVLKHVETISRNPHFSQKHLRCLGSRLVYFAAGGTTLQRRQGGWTGNRGK